MPKHCEQVDVPPSPLLLMTMSLAGARTVSDSTHSSVTIRFSLPQNVIPKVTGTNAIEAPPFLPFTVT